MARYDTKYDKCSNCKKYKPCKKPKQYGGNCKIRKKGDTFVRANDSCGHIERINDGKN